MLEITDNSVLFAFALTLFAGLATGIGSLMALLSKKFSPKFLCCALGLSAGVMVYISLVELLATSKDSLVEVYGAKKGEWISSAAFFAGIAIIAIIDKLVPSYENPHEIHKETEKRSDKKLMRMGLLSAIAIGIHNFPEGIASFVSALQNPTLGLSIAFAIAIHNIPEGIAVSVPIYYATKSRRKAFIYSFLSGLAEPLGALIGYILLRNFLSESLLGIVFAIVAGIMVYISFDELLPTAEEYGEHHIAISGLIAGMAIMAVSLMLF
ncbi:zinc transporter ZupT [Fibrobacterales bacterium]|nr:zinc transporter ZupT [Fibrobacterales bacterium]